MLTAIQNKYGKDVFINGEVVITKYLDYNKVDTEYTSRNLYINLYLYDEELDIKLYNSLFYKRCVLRPYINEFKIIVDYDILLPREQSNLIDLEVIKYLINTNSSLHRSSSYYDRLKTLMLLT